MPRNPKQPNEIQRANQTTVSISGIFISNEQFVELNNAKEQLEQTRVSLETLQSQVIDKDLNSHEAKITKLEEDNAKLREENAQLKAKLHDNEIMIVNQAIRINELQKENEKLKTENAELKQRVKVLEDRIQCLEDKENNRKYLGQIHDIYSMFRHYVLDDVFKIHKSEFDDEFINYIKENRDGRETFWQATKERDTKIRMNGIKLVEMGIGLKFDELLAITKMNKIRNDMFHNDVDIELIDEAIHETELRNEPNKDKVILVLNKIKNYCWV